MITLHDFCPRCERDWEACRCLRLTIEERRQIDETRRLKNERNAAEWAAVQERAKNRKWWSVDADIAAEMEANQ